MKLAAAAAALDPAALRAALAALPPASKHRAYGTAGFRFHVDASADAVFFRMGVLAWARACHVNATVGLCVTASHNPVEDNGVKLIDPDGGMLEQSWEAIATRLVNASVDDCVKLAQELLAKPVPSLAKILLARDTRPHSQHLETLALNGVATCGGVALSMGMLTTPQLHYLVMRDNHRGNVVPGIPTEAGYYVQLQSAYFLLLKGLKQGPLPLTVDCANGIGAVQMVKLLAQMQGLTQIELINTEVKAFDKLNAGCGAEHVQKEKRPPANVVATDAAAGKEGRVYASFDGDADRIVFYYFRNGQMRLLDGDKIACLFAAFVRQECAQIFPSKDDNPSVGCVQTAYANGASSAYLAELGVPAPLVKTGVKYLHHKAVDYDIGIYFEANGHGTVLFKTAFVDKLRSLKAAWNVDEWQTSPADGRVFGSTLVHKADSGSSRDGVSSNEAALAARDRLVAFADLINQATGDAMSDLLAVDAVLRALGWTAQQWDGIYEDLPSRQLKVPVSDRSVVTTIEDESRCLTPAKLQERIDDLVKSVSQGRAFARPSGTEDVVRVYAEAATQSDADWLAQNVALAIYEEASGVGSKPIVSAHSPAKISRAA